MILLGITGAIGHGKTTLAEALQSVEPDTLHLETGMLVAEVANRLRTDNPVPTSCELSAVNAWLRPLPEHITELLHTSVQASRLKLHKGQVRENPAMYEKLFLYIEHCRAKPALATESITPDNKQDHRALLQWLGGFLVKRVDAGIWYNELVRRLTNAHPHLGIISGVRFPEDAQIVKSSGGYIVEVIRPNMPEADLSDPTERERKGIYVDITVYNDGSMKDLYNLAQKLIKDLERNAAQSNYRAA